MVAAALVLYGVAWRIWDTTADCASARRGLTLMWVAVAAAALGVGVLTYAVNRLLAAAGRRPTGVALLIVVGVVGISVLVLVTLWFSFVTGFCGPA